MSAARPLLVAGIGNIFFGDDAFGCEVVRELLRERRPWPPGSVRVEDFGIRSYDLAYALMEGDDAVIIDAAPRGRAPGTVYLIEPDLANLGPGNGADGPPDAHTMSLVSVLNTVESFGGETGRLYLVACEPLHLEARDGHIGLSDPVRAAIPAAVALVERVVDDLLHDRNPVRPAAAEPLEGVS